MRIRKIIALLICVSLMLLCVSGCGREMNSSGKKRIVATIFPEYDWVKQITGENSSELDITLLLSNGVDMHSFQPSVEDIMTISSCDMFIYVGGESDAWVNDALSQSSNKDMIVINLMDILGDKAKEEEIVSGMQSDGDDDGGEEKEYDEHVWLSLRNTALFCDKITEGLAKLDPKNADDYKRNCEEYKKKLNELDGEYKTAVEGSSLRTIIVGDRFPYRYLTDDYNIRYYAAFSGCSAETEASFETIIFLAGKADELNAKAVIKTEGSDGSVAETVRSNTKTGEQEILTLDSMQAAASADIQGGMTYISVMKENLEVLKKAL